MENMTNGHVNGSSNLTGISFPKKKWKYGEKTAVVAALYKERAGKLTVSDVVKAINSSRSQSAALLRSVKKKMKEGGKTRTTIDTVVTKGSALDTVIRAASASGKRRKEGLKETTSAVVERNIRALITYVGVERAEEIVAEERARIEAQIGVSK